MKKRERKKKVFIFWKWTLGEPYYKSAIREKVSLDPNNNNNNNNYDSQQNAISQSLDFTNDIPNPNPNTREELDDKMSGREHVQQRGANPFMQQTSYVNDIVVRDMYLKPLNTTQGKFKSTFEKVEANEQCGANMDF
jgi:hypothetical protein